MRYVIAWAKQEAMHLYKKYWFTNFLITQLDKSSIRTFLPLLWKWDSIIVDSWAFSVWTKWKQLDIDEYARFCMELDRQYWKKLEIYYVNLDVIPWEFWRRPTITEIEDSARQSYERFHYLQKKYPIKRMPVFHQHEKFEWLQKYIDEWVDYIGISPANDLRPAERLRRLKQCFFKYLIPSWKKIRTHWFWITTYSVIKDIPFFSCDSTSRLSWWRFNSYFRFSNWKWESCNAQAIRKKLWIDLAKLPVLKKWEYNLREISKMIKYVNALQRVKNLDYYE